MTKQEFLKDLDNMSNHRVLLWEALQLTVGRVIEFGSGDGSTPYLKQYCSDDGRSFNSFDSDKDWANKTGAIFIDNWSKVDAMGASVLFLDHAPGERRKVDLRNYHDSAKIIVIHDTEPIGAGDYQVRQYFDLFKYCVELPSPGAWTTMLSNYTDLSSLVSKEWNEYKITERWKG